MRELSFFMWIMAVIGCFFGEYYNWSLLVANLFLNSIAYLMGGWNAWMIVGIAINVLNCIVSTIKEQRSK